VPDVQTAGDPRVPVPHVGDTDEPTPRALEREIDAQVQLALVTMGCRKHEAMTAVQRARERVGPDVALEPMMRAALRECRTPSST